MRKVKAPDMRKVTAIVVGFLRPGFSEACVRSLRAMYPDIRILFGNNGTVSQSMRDACREVGARYVRLPYDCGLCYARNRLVEMADTQYVLVGDDDFRYGENALVPEMLDFLERRREYDLIGGRVIEGGVIRNYQGYTDYDADHFVSTPIDLATQKFDMMPPKRGLRRLRHCPADLTFNFFVARRDKVLDVKWDEEIKVAYEHFSWFWDFKLSGAKVAFSPDPVVEHKPQDIDPKESPEYRGFRMRKEDRFRFFDKYRLKYTIGMNGRRTEAPLREPPAARNVKRVDFLITTFRRHESLTRLMDSIAAYYPWANVYVADQDFDGEYHKALRERMDAKGLKKRHKAFKVPYDCGLSFARNFLFDQTPNRYKLLLDDDFVFTERTDVGKLAAVMESDPLIGVVGGAAEQGGIVTHFEFLPRIKDGTIVHLPDGDRWKRVAGTLAKRTGCVLNFALWRRDCGLMLRWDDALKVSEHVDMFLRLSRTEWQVWHVPEVVVSHPATRGDEQYRALRQRPEFLLKALRKHGCTKMRYLDGQVVEAMPDGSLRRYRERT